MLKIDLKIVKFETWEKTFEIILKLQTNIS